MKIHNKGPKSRSKDDADLFEDDFVETKKWYNEFAEDDNNFKPATEQVLIELKDEAKKCHDSEVANYNIKNSKANKNFQWIKTVMSKGTTSDKIAAHTVAIQDNPICNLETVRNLVGMVKIGKAGCISIIETLTELFLSDLLRPDKKLKPFHQRPLSKVTELSSGNAITRRKILSYWYFEDQLKEIYTSFILALNTVSRDTLVTNKEKALGAMYKLLCGNPEQEKNLLSSIVNKLGDPSQKVASKAIYCLSQLLYQHSNMQAVVLKEVEKLLFRANVSTRSQYYGLCFLSQFYLNHDDREVAAKLIDVYFAFFKACIKKGEVDSRMMSALLMGVNRAYPYAKLEMDKMSEHIDTIYRVVHVANFNVSLHALTLLYQVSDYANNITDRFYSALYKKILDPQIGTTSHQAMLLSLIYKALLKDTEINRVKALVKRLLQICLHLNPSFICGILYLISQLITKKENVFAVILKKAKIKEEVIDEDDEEEVYVDVKDEVDNSEIKEEVLDQENSTHENASTEPTINQTINDSIDVDNVKSPKISNGPGWYHCKTTKNGKKEEISTYNPHCRNPLYAGAENTAYLELINLKNHFHPSVVLYANSILNGELIKYSGDPLKDFTLIRFLDRFVFKNPKKLEDLSKQGAHPTFGKRKLYQAKGVKSLGVNSYLYLRENEANIPVDEKFLYSYIQNKYRERKHKDEEDNEDDDSDVESVEDDEFEDLLDKMGGKINEEDDDDIDFMNDIGENLKNKKSKKKASKDAEESESDEEHLSESEDEEFDGEDDDLEGSDIDFDGADDDLDDFNDEDKELLDDLDDDENDEEDLVFGDSDEDGAPSTNKKSKNKNVLKDIKKLKGGEGIHSLFASADEFATLLEDEGSSKVAPGGSNTYANKDNANVKQLDWEDNRNRWLGGFNKAVKGGGNKKFQKNSYSKKRGNSNQMGNNKKKFKK